MAVARLLLVQLERNDRTHDHAVRVFSAWGDTRLDAQVAPHETEVHLGSKANESLGALWAPLDDLGRERVFVSYLGPRPFVVVPEGCEVWRETGRDQLRLPVTLEATERADAAGVCGLHAGERIVVRQGSVLLSAELEPALDETLPRSERDWAFARVLLTSLLVHGFFIFGAIITPKLSTGLSDELRRGDPTSSNWILREAELEPKKKLELSGAKGTPAKDKEGLIGQKNRPVADKMASKAGAPRVDPNKRTRDREIVMKSGLLGMFGAEGRPSAVDSVLGSSEIGRGLNEALGGLKGAEHGDAGGAGGLGSRGLEGGGGGGPLGLGGLGGGPRRGGGGPGNVDLGGPGKRKTRLLPGKTIVQGSLSRSEIGRVIRDNLVRFKFCYERELNADQGLTGKVSVHFTIAPTGSVAKAAVRESSLGSNKVERCILDVMQSLHFPPPRGGGVVIVTYPFVFASP